MSAISLKSISGITSITTPAGVDDQLTLHNNNTTERVKIDVAGNVHVNNHLAVAGVTTFAGNIELTGALNNDLARIKIPDGMNGSPFTGNLEFGNNRDFVVLHDGHHNYVKANNGNIYVTCGGNTLTTLQTNGTVLLNKDLDVDGHTNLDNVSISGVTTFSHTGANQLVIKDSDTSGDAAHMRISFQDSGGTEKFFVGNNNSNGWLYIGSASGQNNNTVVRVNGQDKIQVNQNGLYVGGYIEILDTILHSGDTDTKIRFPSADTITFETAGNERLRVNSSGLVSIPGDIDIDGHTNLDNTSIVGIVTISAGTNNEGLRITGQHNNCVIFTSPSINGSAGYRLNHHPSTNFLRVDTTDQNGTFTSTVAKFSTAGLDMADNIKLRLGSNQDLTLYHYGNDAYIDNADGDIIFRQGTSEKLRIDSSGRIIQNYAALPSISSNLPYAYFAPTKQNYGGVDLTMNLHDDASNALGNGGGIGFSANSSSGSPIVRGAIRGNTEATDSTAGYLSFFTRPASGSNTEKLRIDSSGRALFSGALGYGNIPFGGNPANAAIQIRCNSKYNGIAFGENAVSGCIGMGGAESSTAMVFVANAHPANLGGGAHDTFEWWSGNSGGGGPAKFMTLNTQGHLELTSGNLEFANGNGIDFSAVPDGGRSLQSDGNKFDDYEEGYWTPTLYYGNGTSEASYSWRYGHYIKVGKQVTVWFNIGISNFTATYSQAYIGGLPFQSNDPAGQWKYLNHMMGYSFASGWGDQVDDKQMFLAIYDNQTKMMINHEGNHLSTGNIGSGQRFSCTVTYQTD